MLKKLVIAVSLVAVAGPAQAATYVVLPDPGSMSPPTVIVDANGSKGPIFVCASFSDVAAGTCRLHKSRRY